jgi:hypothetical protein
VRPSRSRHQGIEISAASSRTVGTPKSGGPVQKHGGVERSRSVMRTAARNRWPCIKHRRNSCLVQECLSEPRREGLCFCCTLLHGPTKPNWSGVGQKEALMAKLAVNLCSTYPTSRRDVDPLPCKAL